MTDKQSKADRNKRMQKEIEAAILPLQEAVRQLQEELRELKKARKTSDAAPAPVPEPKKIRMGKAEITRLRKKLKFGRKKFALLFGVSAEEINSWERGDDKPTIEQKQQLDTIRRMKKKQLAALLETVFPKPAATETTAGE